MDERNLHNRQEDPPDEISIPSDECTMSAVRSAGAGGQNVNKVATKIVLKWNVQQSAVLTTEQKDRIRDQLSNRINSDGELVISSQKERSQLRNRRGAVDKLHQLIYRALDLPEERIPTRKPRNADERRLQDKKRQSEKKGRRRARPNDE